MRVTASDIEPEMDVSIRPAAMGVLDEEEADTEDMMALETPTLTQQSVPKEPYSADFGNINRIAQSSGLDIGKRIDSKLLADVDNDPYQYVQVRSDPEKYREFLGEPAQMNRSKPQVEREMRKQSQPVAMPATQAQPPRPRLASVPMKR